MPIVPYGQMYWRAPDAVGKGEHGAVTVALESSEQLPLDEVEEAHLTIHAARDSGIDVVDVSYAAYSPCVNLFREVAVDFCGLARILATCGKGVAAEGCCRSVTHHRSRSDHRGGVVL